MNRFSQKCPLNGPKVGERSWGLQIGAAEHILLYIWTSRLPLTQILHQQLWELSLSFLEKARPCLLFFSKIYLPSLIDRVLCRILSVMWRFLFFVRYATFLSKLTQPLQNPLRHHIAFYNGKEICSQFVQTRKGGRGSKKSPKFCLHTL